MVSKRLEFMAGIFFLIGIILFAAVIWTLGIKKDIGEKRFKVEVYFGDIAGLGVGAPARLSGVNIGYVESVDFSQQPIDGKHVKVILNIADKYRIPLQRCTKYTIATSGILGDKLVKISRDPLKHMCDLERPIKGEDPLEIQDLTKSLQDTAQSLSSLANETNVMVQDLDYILITVKRILNRVERGLIEGDLFRLF